MGKSTAHGKKLRQKFEANVPALGKLVAGVKAKAKETGTLKALDGAPLHVRSEHSALNTLLQSAGALICKRWIVTFERMMVEEGFDHGADFLVMAWIHDELQVAARTREIAEAAAIISEKAMKETEAYYDSRIPLTTDSKIGGNWAECH